MRWLALGLVLACSGERAAQTVERHATVSTPADAALDAVRDAAVPALATLQARAPALADVIARRIAQRSPKMQLTAEQGEQVAAAVLAAIDRESMQALARVMPRSAVELARAVRERGVAPEEADRIAGYLVRVVTAIEPERLATFDDNHSHVTGRDWHEIDYQGESMTWQGQRDAWTPKGVASFKRAEYIHAYFVGAEKLEHWKRVYRPRGRISAVTPP